MPNKTLYVSERHAPVWAAVEALAADGGLSVSTVVARALEYFLQRAAVEPVGMPALSPEVVKAEAFGKVYDDAVGRARDLAPDLGGHREAILAVAAAIRSLDHTLEVMLGTLSR